MGRKAKRELSAKELRIRKKKRRRRLLIAEGIILVLLVAVLFVWLKVGMISFEELDTQTNDLDEETQKVMEEYITVAIFGVDNRSNGNYDSGNSDSIMIANIDNNTGEIKIVSVYRDTCMDVGWRRHAAEMQLCLQSRRRRGGGQHAQPQPGSGY